MEKKKVDATIDEYAKTMSRKWKNLYKREAWRVISKGLTEDMFDDKGVIDPNVLKIVNIRLHAFREGWRAATD